LKLFVKVLKNTSVVILRFLPNAPGAMPQVVFLDNDTSVILWFNT
jgi:hypothetical protein